MTNREKILKLLKNNEEMSCYTLSKEVYGIDEDTMDKWKISSINGGISSILRKMVTKGEIEVSPNKAIRGGKMYKLKIV